MEGNFKFDFPKDADENSMHEIEFIMIRIGRE